MTVPEVIGVRFPLNPPFGAIRLSAFLPGEFSACVNHIHHLNARCCDTVQNNVIGVNHDLAQTQYALTWLVQVRMFGRVLQCSLYEPIESLGGLFVASLM